MRRASPTTLATTMVVMRAFVGIMAGPPLPGHSLTCIAHPAWPFLARQSRRVGKAKRAHLTDSGTNYRDVECQPKGRRLQRPLRRGLHRYRQPAPRLRGFRD